MIWTPTGADKTNAHGDSDDSDTDSEEEGGRYHTLYGQTCKLDWTE